MPPNPLPNMMIQSKTNSHPPSLLYFCRESSTNRPLFCTNEPNSQNSQNQHNTSSHKGLRQISSISHYQKRTQTNPNEPKANPICQKPKNQPNFFSRKDLRQYGPFRVTKNKPKRTQNEPNLSRRSPLAAPRSSTKPDRPNRFKPKFYNFAYKNSLTDTANSLSYRFSLAYRSCYEKLYG